MYNAKEEYEKWEAENAKQEFLDLCEECGQPWNSEYHISDVCVNYSEEKDEFK